MRVANIETVRLIGEEYGWTEAQIEQALASAIRLCYAEKDMLVEVDVNLKEQTIATRRRNGYGDRGVWIDIRDPLMPSVNMFMQIMEIHQWGDGAPGRVLEGEVAGYRDGGIFYRVGTKHVYIPENLLSVMDFHEKPALGTKQVLTLCASRDGVAGMRVGTRRGKEFVAAVMECYYPECISGIWMGASNSWAVIRMTAEHMSMWLENGGVNVRHLQNILGVRRITLLPEGEGETEEEMRANEIRHFVNNAWQACRVASITEDRIVIHTPIDNQDPRKVRTFTSMLKKIAPEREQVIM
ncbi:MAG: hypothetical protein VXY83_05415 [Pseudomonadota bacterium]|nr:hypothetical protein [Magnetococcales bacterium]MEC8067810.1 hypothetical protein [Pseudomonadota bacterium]MEC8467783.1 hypothetical protein [Pseudomonadota bacterium]|tara:strand:- start:35102 stop:35992 length:891 start_codon:yes stop_codon:yes gene_type:complete